MRVVAGGRVARARRPRRAGRPRGMRTCTMHAHAGRDRTRTSSGEGSTTGLGGTVSARERVRGKKGADPKYRIPSPHTPSNKRTLALATIWSVRLTAVYNKRFFEQGTESRNLCAAPKELPDGRGRRAGLPPVRETAGPLGEPSDGKRRSSCPLAGGGQAEAGRPPRCAAGTGQVSVPV
eukprot:SAG22_NODE_956_length_6320_cov_2.476933_5_plen_179_part_00